VLDVETSHLDGEIAATGKDNYVVIGHADGSTALYGHLTNRGTTLMVGDVVMSGGFIGFSGNSGNTANVPHLHVSLQGCDPVTRGTEACPTLPLTFRNTDANPTGLLVGRAYRAR
jgi:murein DD-endopeptidase MepM/ murein hydrolase activator NlpD